LHKISSSGAAWLAKLAGLFPEREIFLRSGKQVRFLRITRRAQIVGLACVMAALLAWGGLALRMMRDSAAVARDRTLVEQRGKLVGAQASKVKDYKQSVDALAHDLEARQNIMDDLYRTHFGSEQTGNAAQAVVGPADSDAPAKADPRKVSLGPQAAPLLKIEARQRRFALLLTAAVQRRADKAAAAIRSFGLDPNRIARATRRAEGGPFVPWRGNRDVMTGELATLAGALDRMETLERSLVAIPSGKPTAAPMETSSYGFRRDPFNGQAAFHAGIDFPGSYGQPILAAAKGKVVYVGQRQGYGNVVEVEHGNGLMTRYAHLSGFVAYVGQQVARGEQIARMGSTGRSTGTHLHFEVRLNGQAINPRRFLEARQDVLQVQQLAKARFADVGNRG
jgi:murein DD-endopeptidase MepM/ murein hydrolase activator NlpD